MLVKLPHRTMTFGIKLFSMQLSNIFRRPRSVSGLSSQTSDNTKNLISGSSSCTRLANVFFATLVISAKPRGINGGDTHIFEERRCSSTEEVNVAKN